VSGMRFLFLALIVQVVVAAEQLRAFADGEVVAFVGDSITHDGRWHRYIAEFYATRFPDRRIIFINAGVSGDSAGGALQRLDADVLSWKPTTAVVMLGMNDVGRDAYRPGSDGDAQMQAIRERHLTTYADNLGKLAARLGATCQRLVLVTPSPYEDTATLAAANLPGCNAALGRASQTVARLAAERQAGLVDLHAPMTTLDRLRQQQDPAFTLIGIDRVHPGSPGHLVMAWLFLKAQGVPALVSRTAADVLARTAQVENATISDIAFQDGGLSFTLSARCLPFAIADDARPALAYAAIEAELDREEVQVAYLAEGTWMLDIDGSPVGTWTAAEFAKGVPLGLNAKTPQYRQALQVQRLCEERRTVEHRLRAVAMVEYRVFKVGEVDLTRPDLVAAAIEQRLAANPAPYLRKMLEECRTSRPEVAPLRARVQAMSETIRLAAQPKSHKYRIYRNP